MSVRLAIACAALTACGGGELITPELPACGQFRDGHWDQRLVSPGVSGSQAHVLAIVRRSDGAIIAGGSFTGMSGTSARSVALWDGTAWSALGDGLPGTVESLAIADDGELWATGSDELDGELGGEIGGGTSYLARWTGTQWRFVVEHAFGIAGVTAIDGGIAVYGSFFAQPPALPATGVAILRDGVWSQTGMEQTSSVSIRAVVRVSQHMCAAGRFQFSPFGDITDGVACWNGAAWNQLGSSVPGLSSLARGGDGRWYAGGAFSVLEGGNPRYGIVRLDTDAVWRPLAGGVHAHEVVEGGGDAWTPEVTAISADADGIVIAGHFEWVGIPKARAYNLARWSDATGWSSMTPPTDLFGSLSTVLATDRGDAYVGGGFTRIGIGAGAGIASVVDDQVHALPAATLAPPRVGTVHDMVNTRDGIVLAGRFSATGDPEETAIEKQTLVRFDGAWSDLADVPASDGTIAAVALPDDGLAVRNGGLLYRRYGDGPWTQLTSRETTGPLAVDGDGTLFFVVDSDGADSIVRATRDDVSFFARVPGDTVSAMTIYDGALIIVTMRSAGGQVAYRYIDDDWQVIGAWPEPAESIAASPALGLVVGTRSNTRIWNGAEWRTLPAAAFELAACSDGVVAAIDEGNGGRLAFLGDASSGWTYFGEPNGALWWQIVPSERGIYTSSSAGTSGFIDDNAPMGFARWTTFDDSGW